LIREFQRECITHNLWGDYRGEGKLDALKMSGNHRGSFANNFNQNIQYFFNPELFIEIGNVPVRRKILKPLTRLTPIITTFVAALSIINIPSKILKFEAAERLR